jgi:Protein of unknown function (DUF3617)
MRKLMVCTVTCLWASILLAASGKYQPLNVKTGLWETTWSDKITGRLPIPQDTLDKMTPEQRAKFEAAMNNMAEQTPKTRTARSCLTKEKLEKDPFNRDDKECTETVLTSTGSKVEVQEVCTHENAKTDVRVHIEALDSENVKGTVESNASGGGKTMSINGTFTSKWLGAVCTDKDEH